MNYRAEIDGLRALAVVSVILYHAQIVVFGRDWFEGGFIGVDIFFVISGYLITRIILTELENTNTFSFIKFYERRARRILPMLLVVIAVCLPFAWQKLLPLDLVEFAESALSAIGFGSNFYFYFSTTEYGADSALLKPLLHTWSLGVEEQFYIIAPIIILLSWKFARASLLTLLVGTLIMSIQFADVMEVKNSELNFFLPFSRFWELLVGSALALIELKYGRSKNPILTQTLPIIGLFLIAHSILFFDDNTPHPSFQTLIPILGIALILAFCSKEDIVGKLLSFKPIVGVGLISYSLYLWHFPILAFGRIGSSNPTTYDKVEWVALAFVLSIVSYLFIEKTFRNSKVFSKKAFCSFVVASIVALTYVNYDFISNDGYKDRYPDWLVNSNKPWELLKKNGVNCYARNVNPCFFENNANSPTVITIGDSHLGSIEYDLTSRYGDEFNFLTMSLTGCPIFLKHSRYRSETNRKDNCTAEYQNLRLDKIRDFQNPIVILYSRLPLYLSRSRFNSYDNQLDNWGYEWRDNNGNPINYQSSFYETVHEISKITKNIILVSPTPEFGINLKNKLLSDYDIPDLAVATEKQIAPISFDYKIYLERVNTSLALIESVKNFVTVVDSSEPFCNSFVQNECVASMGTQLFYFDADHLNNAGAKLLNNKIVQTIHKIIESEGNKFGNHIE
ncbi:acyltransferase [Alphaproteobacteria bacterium]|nr:acyltransferase [Alphaproteobacteria bacterium]